MVSPYATVLFARLGPAIETNQCQTGKRDETMGSIVAAGALIVLALAHSVAGETGFVQPLLAADWELKEVPRWAADRITRGAWHLSSVAWLGLAAVALGVSPLTAVGLATLASGVVMVIAIRAHMAWPLFILGGAAALEADGRLPEALLVAVVILAIVALIAAGLLHVYWALGGKRWGANVIPTTKDGQREFEPPPVLTLLVAVALFVFAGLLGTTLVGDPNWVIRAMIIAGTAVLALRAIGDGRQAGFTKSDHGTDFAHADDQIFTPLVTFLAFGAGAALLLA